MTVKVADFGNVSRCSMTLLTQTADRQRIRAGLAKIQGGKVEAGWGTQFYMSPEAQRGDAVITEKADVFRFASSLFSCSCFESSYTFIFFLQLWRVLVAAPLS